MNKRLTKHSQKGKGYGFQRIEESYVIPTYMVPDYLGETQPAKVDKPMREDLGLYPYKKSEFIRQSRQLG